MQGSLSPDGLSLGRLTAQTFPPFVEQAVKLFVCKEERLEYPTANDIRDQALDVCHSQLSRSRRVDQEWRHIGWKTPSNVAGNLSHAFTTEILGDGKDLLLQSIEGATTTPKKES